MNTSESDHEKWFRLHENFQRALNTAIKDPKNDRKKAEYRQAKMLLEEHENKELVSFFRDK